MNQIFIQVRFSEQTKYGEYQDALYYTEDEYAKLTEEDITAAKQARIDNWIQVVENPPIVVKPTKEELQAQETELQKQLTEIQEQIATKEVVKETVIK